MDARVRPHVWSVSRFLLTLFCASIPSSLTAADCADVARLRGPVTSVVEWQQQQQQEPPADDAAPTGFERLAARVEVAPDRRSARIENSYWRSDVVTCRFDQAGRVVRQVTSVKDERGRWQVEQDLRWTYGSRSFSVRDRKSRYRLRVTVDEAGAPVHGEGQGSYPMRVPITTSVTRWAQEVESWEAEDHGDVGQVRRWVHDLEGNLLVDDLGSYPYDQAYGVSTYEFDGFRNWTTREERWTTSDHPHGWRNLYRRVITYRTP